ncbi:multicopper oxidase domain-containing protein, partial [Microbispora rosea]|uniref:multicopper oxidase domain-containing protein n=1 Tax=Microbispora rosea TaxID=58117 RepID=UPI003412F75E
DYTAKLGERVEFIVIAHGNLFHTFHIHGHRWADNRTGMLKDPQDQSRIIDTKTTGPAESFGFQIIAGELVGPGMWMYHCHVQSHSDMGMAGMFMVADANGNVPGHSMDDMPEHSTSGTPSPSMDDMPEHSMSGTPSPSMDDMSEHSMGGMSGMSGMTGHSMDGS